MALLASLWGFYVRGSSRLTNMLSWPGLDTVLGASSAAHRNCAQAKSDSRTWRAEYGVRAYVEDGDE